LKEKKEEISGFFSNKKSIIILKVSGFLDKIKNRFSLHTTKEMIEKTSIDFTLLT